MERPRFPNVVMEPFWGGSIFGSFRGSGYAIGQQLQTALHPKGSQVPF